MHNEQEHMPEEKLVECLLPVATGLSTAPAWLSQQPCSSVNHGPDEKLPQAEGISKWLWNRFKKMPYTSA